MGLSNCILAAAWMTYWTSGNSRVWFSSLGFARSPGITSTLLMIYRTLVWVAFFNRALMQRGLQAKPDAQQTLAGDPLGLDAGLLSAFKCQARCSVAAER